MRNFVMLAVLAAVLSGTPLTAQQGEPRRPRDEPGGAGPPAGERLEALFDRTDANSDGKITKEEVPEGLRERFGRMLERIDAEAANKEQFGQFMARTFQGGPGAGRPGDGRPGEGRPPLIAALDADSDGEISASEIEGASKALAKLDKNGDGKLSRAEIAPPGRGDRRPGDAPPAAGRGQFSREQFQARLKEADKNGDGKLSKEEAPPMLQDRFDAIDGNSDGQLDQEELRRIFERMRRQDGDRRPDAPRRD